MRTSREYEVGSIAGVLSLAKSAAIWSAIDLVIVKFAGAGLNEAPDGEGADSEQFMAQQRRATAAAFDLSLLFARLQHSIIP